MDALAPNPDSTPEGMLSKHVRHQGLHLLQTDGIAQGRSFALPMGELIVGSAADCQIQLDDKGVSRQHCAISRSDNGLRVRDLQSTNGTRVDGVVVESAFLRVGSLLRVGSASFHVKVGYSPVVPGSDNTSGFRGLVGRSEAMRAVFAARSQLANSDVTVLISGETGTGKSALARSIHRASQRRDKPFVVFDCGAVTPSLIESELFGHERGAFTGADKARAGAIETAADGTLFIDELSELPLDLQPKLLRALEEREFKRVGSTAGRPVACRIVTASQHDIWQLVEANKFRKDLYFRVAVVVVPLPPLRERREDIPPIVDHMLAVMEAPTVAFSHLPESIRTRILNHDWAGNIRELRNFLERYFVTQSDALPAAGTTKPAAPGQASELDLNVPFRELKQSLIDSFEKRYLTLLLRSTNHNIAQASKVSGVDRRHLHDLVRKHGLDRATLMALAHDGDKDK